MSVYRTVAAWRHALESVLALGQRLSDAQWLAPTECPDWTVKDIYAHLIGGEQWMAEGHPPPSDGFAQWAQEPVRTRRGTPAIKLLAELREVYERRRVQLDSTPIDPDEPAHMVTGEPMPLGLLLQVRVLDVWVHEQDIRRAVGVPGNLDSPGAAIAGELFVASLPRIVAKGAAAPSGAVVRLTTSGEVTIDAAVSVGSDGKGRLVPAPQSATTHLNMSWEAYTRLSAGRGAPTDYDVNAAGDQHLADRVLSQLATTP